MTKMQENDIKSYLFHKGEFVKKEDFAEFKQEIKDYIEKMHNIIGENEDVSYVDEMDYELYLKWFAEFHKKIYEAYFILTQKINNFAYEYLYSQFDKDKVYTVSQLEDLFKKHNLSMLYSGFGKEQN